MAWAEKKTKTTDSKRKGKFGRSSIWTWIILFGLGGYLIWDTQKNALRPNPDVEQHSEETPIKAFTTVQSADGVTESDLDQTLLNNLEKWIVGTIQQKGELYFSEIGLDPTTFNPEFSASSLYAIVEGKKLALIKVSSSSFRLVTVMGIKGTELIRVACIRRGNHDIPVWHGVCGDEVRKSLGVTAEL